MKQKIALGIILKIKEINKIYEKSNKIYQTGCSLYENNDMAKAFFISCIVESRVIEVKIEALSKEIKTYENIKTELALVKLVKGKILNLIGQSYLGLNQVSEAMPFLIRSADECENKKASQSLGLCYYSRQYYQKAFNYLNRDVLTTYQANVALADLYERGYGEGSEAKKKQNADECYKKAEICALEEPPKAKIYMSLATCYCLGKLHPSSKEGLYWQMAADLGSAEAQHRTARLLEEGSGGFIKDIEAAIKRYRQSIAQGRVNAAYDLAELLYSRRGTEDLKEAYRLYEFAADSYPPAKIGVARCLFHGFGVSKDVQKSIEIYNNILQNHSIQDLHRLAHHNLGVIYCEEYYNFAEAAKYWQLAAVKDYGESQVNLALFHELGLAVEANTSTAIILLEKAAKNKSSVVLSERAEFMINEIKKRCGQIIQQKEDKKPVDIFSDRSMVASTAGVDLCDDKLAFKKLNQILVKIAKNPYLYKDEKIRSLFANIITATTFDHINLVAALFNIGKLFHAINNQPQVIKEYTEQIKVLINSVRDRMPYLEMRETANALHGLSLLHLRADEEPLIHCIRLLLSKTERDIQRFTTQDLDMAIGAIARFNLPSMELMQAKCLILAIQNRWREFDIVQLIHLAYSLAVLDVYQKKIHCSCFSASRLGKQVFTNIAKKMPSDVKQLQVSSRSQLNLGLRYFSQNYSDAKIDPTKWVLEPVVSLNTKSPYMSEFQKQVTDFIQRNRIKTDHEIKIEFDINGLPVDIYCPDENQAIQANGPTHYSYSLDLKSEPIPTLKEQFHNNLLVQYEKAPILVSCFEWSKQKTAAQKRAYLISLGIKLVPVKDDCGIAPKKPLPMQAGRIYPEMGKKQVRKTGESVAQTGDYLKKPSI